MIALLRKTWQMIARETNNDSSTNSLPETLSAEAKIVTLEITNGDPLLDYLEDTADILDVADIPLDSPAVQALKKSRIALLVPLIHQGKLIGLVGLGQQRSEMAYSLDDRQLLNSLAMQVSPSLRVAQLVNRQRSEDRKNERLAQELRVARIVQETLLPAHIPSIPNWQIAAHWQPAREVSGDFYDFIPFPDGKIGVVIADVADKGIPSALIMATTRSTLRSVAERLISPGQVLAEANNLLCPDTPMSMFITCFYGLIDPVNGRFLYANAGHPPPYHRLNQQVAELRARGMPLGLMPDMTYDEKEAIIHPGESIFMYSDGLLEAHNPRGEMFGNARIQEMLVTPHGGEGLIQALLAALPAFGGPGWEQEDDVTLVCLARLSLRQEQADDMVDNEYLLAEFTFPSEPGNEKLAMEEVAAAVQELALTAKQRERLKTAVAEATMNAIEHGNQYRSEKPVHIFVYTSDRQVRIEIVDYGGDREIPEPEPPDLERKLQGLQSPRGWGMLIIKSMVDAVKASSDGVHHTLELSINLPGKDMT